MDSKYEVNIELGYKSTNGTASSSLQKADGGCSLSNVQSCNTSECSAFNYVYRRRRLLKNPAPLPQAYVTAKKESPDTINFVYERRKRQKSGVTNFFGAVLSKTSASGACSYAVGSENRTTATIEKAEGVREEDAARSVSAIVGNKELHFTTSDTIIGCSIDNRCSNSKDKMIKTAELCSVDDSCSSSMLNINGGLVPSNTEIYDTDECSSSGAHVSDVMKDDLSLSLKALCVSVLQSYGLLNVSGPSDEDSPSCSGSDFSRSCHVCGLTESALEMLICDECDKAFHLSCFNPSIKKIPIDDWHCQSCAKKKHNFNRERAVRKSSIIGSGKGSVTSEGHSSAIELMLKDTRPYVTSVRVGKGFQAVVPEWCGPATKDPDEIPEPTELDSSFGTSLHSLVREKPRKSNFIGNWLQCKDIIIGMGDDIDGSICGKWRRAPLFEVQTDKWDCFHSVLWDPTYADCCVPQELETEEVLKQLKYIELLRPRLQAKKRKLDTCGVTGANGSMTEDASAQTV
ncbi:hypothetical protein RND81_06G190800 [Saponaria officinalis]|uniref:Uncharacterized protein n=1 Tax=Saponaria officinalis TaxID=3572 RepID=A0AAW1KBS6_SAPOF